MRTTITVPNPTPNMTEYSAFFGPIVVPLTNNRKAVRGRKKATVPHETIAQAKTAVSLVVQQIVAPVVIDPPIKKIEPPSVLIPLHQLKRMIGFNVVAEIKKMYEREFIKNHLQNVATPWGLVQEIFQKLKIGDGTFLCMFNVEWVAYLVRVLKKDVNTIFFVDDGLDMKDGTGKISSIKAQLVIDMFGVPKGNIIHHSKIERMTMKFDYIVGNPPYDGAAALHQKFFVKAFNLITETGKVAFIQPATPYFNKKNVRKKTADLEMITIVKDFAQAVVFCDETVFEGADVGTKLAITIASKRFNNGKIDVRYMNGDTIVSNFDGINQLQINPDVYSSIRTKYEKMSKLNGSFLSVVSVKTENKAYLAKIRGNVNGNPDFYTLVPNKTYRDKHFTCGNHDFGIPISENAHLQNFYDYCETFFARFALAMLKINPNSHRGEFALIPLVDFSRTYTEDELFDMAGFTDEEREIIMSTLPDYHNRRK